MAGVESEPLHDPEREQPEADDEVGSHGVSGRHVPTPAASLLFEPASAVQPRGPAPRRIRGPQDATPEAGSEPGIDRSRELWRAAKQHTWSARPWRRSLRPLARALGNEESIIVCLRLTMTYSAALTIVVTDQNLHVAPDGISFAWLTFRGTIPEQFRQGRNRVSIPLRELDGTPVVNGNTVTLRTLDQEPITLTVAFASQLDRLLDVMEKVQERRSPFSVDE
jgi:hypothetical protein